jgi:mRNA interferase MazF
MKRGDLYLVVKPHPFDSKKQRVCVVVSRQWLIDSAFPTVICAPVLSKRLGITTQVNVDIEDGLKHESAICCDDLISVRKRELTNYVGSLRPEKLWALNLALAAALDLMS